MPTRKNKILTMIFGLLPGAGHMFMGFMHLGVSYMTLFFGVIAIIFFLDAFFYAFGFIGFILPVVWCYAFFDCLNKCYASDEEFYAIKDQFLFLEGSSLPKLNYKFDFHLGRYARLFLGWLLVLSGSTLMLRRILRFFSNNGLMDWDSPIYRIFDGLLDAFPQLLAALIIIYIGLRLIFGKRKELKTLKALIEPDVMEDIQDLEEVEHHE